MLRVMGFGKEEVPQALLLSFYLEVLEDGPDCFPSLYWVSRQLSMCKGLGRLNLVLKLNCELGLNTTFEMTDLEKGDDFGEGFFAKRCELVFDLRVMRPNEI